MESDFEITLEHIENRSNTMTFRVAFHSSNDRWLLPYPRLCGLRFSSKSGESLGEWGARMMISKPRDQFVLNPTHRIAFDLVPHVNTMEPVHEWVISLPPGPAIASFVFDEKADLRDHLKITRQSQFRSHFVESTRPWSGSAISNEIPVVIPECQEDVSDTELR